ncbi:MAG: hypothetical protein RSA90_01520 [Lachnospiraceae bacterium]
MNETEKRRNKLLGEMRGAYSDRRVPPAIHPRYGNTYAQLYGHKEDIRRSTLGVRSFLCILLFTLFLAADYKDTTVGKIDTKKVVKEIKTNLDLETMWNNL